ncbi:MAG: glycosyltransferase [Pseudomonadota bacterium]
MRKVAPNSTHPRRPVRRQVFFDPEGRRGRGLRGLALAGAVVIFGLLLTFMASLLYVSKLPPLSPEGETQMLAAPKPTGTPPDCAAAAAGPVDVWAYLRVWPVAAIPSLARHCGAVDAVLAEWVQVDVAYGSIQRLAPDHASDQALRTALGTGHARVAVHLVAILTMPRPLDAGAMLLDDPVARQIIVDGLTRAAHPYAGLCLRPEKVAPNQIDGVLLLLSDLRTAMPHTPLCLVAEGEGILWRDPRIVAAVDHVVFQAFRGGNGPLAPQAWFDALIEQADAQLGDKLVVALGGFAQDDAAIPFAEAMRLAARFGGTISFDGSFGNSVVRLADTTGARHEIWLLDAASANNQRKVLDRLGIRSVAVWSVGAEDPGVWAVLANNLAGSERINLPDYVGYEGSGPFRRVTQLAQQGARRFVTDGAGVVTDVTYQQVPRPVTVQRFGGRSEKVAVLTFDDGPDPAGTTAILDSLADKGVPAAFFVTGANVVRHPDLLRRILREGHEVGSHTFLHPDATQTGGLRLRLELNALQRVLVGVGGRGTVLFRSPYGRSEGPVTADEAAPYVPVQTAGYLQLGADVVPRDWEGQTASQIVADAMGQLGSGSQVIVLHDAGGDRAATVAAVPLLIDRLRADGYRLVSVATLLGTDRDALMPVQNDFVSRLDWVWFNAIVWAGKALVWVLWITVIAGVGRAMVVLTLALLRRRHPVATDYMPAVTLLIPAYNEAAHVVDSIRTSLASDYPDLRLIVVDDGSTDGTAAAVEAAFASDPRVTLLCRANGGKAEALNAAYALVQTEVVVALDADTRLDPDAIRLLARHFADPAVGAVAGVVRVGNRRNALTWFQALEYVTAQNVDRRAVEGLNAMLVVPGAVGAWRVAAVRAVGLYSSETLAEDADLTVSLLRAGYRIVFEDRARATTDVPDRLRPFLAQRLRWSFGMIQTAWKHRHVILERRAVGVWSIPDLWLAGVALGLLAPFADLLFLGLVADAALNLTLGQPAFSASSAGLIAAYLALPAVEIVAATLALRLDRTEPWWLVLLVPLQRLFYRPLIYLSIWRAVWRAVTGRRGVWGRIAQEMAQSAN